MDIWKITNYMGKLLTIIEENINKGYCFKNEIYWITNILSRRKEWKSNFKNY